jgi:hypothetical protein
MMGHFAFVGEAREGGHPPGTKNHGAVVPAVVDCKRRQRQVECAGQGRRDGAVQGSCRRHNILLQPRPETTRSRLINVIAVANLN